MASQLIELPKFATEVKQRRPAKITPEQVLETTLTLLTKAQNEKTKERCCGE